MIRIKKGDIGKKELTEFVDKNGSMSDGNLRTTNNSEIETGPSLDFDERGVPPTTDDVVRMTRQRNSFYDSFMVTNQPLTKDDFKGRNRTIYLENRIKNIVEDALSGKTYDTDIIQRNVMDINKNNIDDIEELRSDKKNLILLNRVRRLITDIKNSNADSRTKGVLLADILNSVDFSDIPNEYKNFIREKLK
jgi:hypothetical protein